MRNFFVRLNFAQRNYAQIVVIAGVRFVGMINIFEITADPKTLRFAQPKYVGTVSFAVLAVNGADNCIPGDVHSRK